MKVLHLLSDYKWTGPADPAIRLAAEQRRLGADVVFALPTWTHPGAEPRVRMELLRRRIPVIAGLAMRKHLTFSDLRRDVTRLARRLDDGQFGLLHSHLRGDHLVATLAVRKSRRPVPVVRSLYEPQAPPAWPRQILAFSRTAAVVAPTLACAADVARRFGLPARRVVTLPPPVESDVFTPRGTGPDLREHWGLSDEHFVIGIVARVQPHRRFELLWEVAARVVARCPHARFVVLGRGDPWDVQALCFDPVDRLGLTDKVLFPGYRYGDGYPVALRTLDAFVFLVPGSDGTCRAVREALATGLPVVASDLGILPALVGDGERGVAVAAEPGPLAEALVALAQDRGRTRAVGAAARQWAVAELAPARHARAVLRLYDELAASGDRGAT